VRHAVSWSLVALALVALAPAAVADDSTVAEQLFREGKRLLAGGKTAEACKAFEGSYRKDPAVTTLLNLADCREKNGQFATAWGQFLEVQRLARGKADTAAYANTGRDRASNLEGRLSFLIINVPAGSSVEGLQILRNGVVVDSAEWNTEIPVDGGEYKIDGSAPGYEPWSTKVKVEAERDKVSVDVPPFRRRAQTGASGHHEDKSRDTSPESLPERSKTGPVLVAGGTAAVLAGISIGYLAQQRFGEAEDLCGTDHVCDSLEDQRMAQELANQARLRGNISTIVTSVGVVAVGAGVILWWRRGKASSSSSQVRLRVDPVIGPSSVGLAVGGSL
jgi:hypothetical protein